MRLCTIAKSGFEVLFSTVGSEPLLAKAATMAMAKSETNLVQLLLALLDKNWINHGEGSKLIAALLVMQARDATLKKGQRWVYVPDFLDTLLGCCTCTDTALPSATVSQEDYKPLAMTFEGAHMWFNHVIKV